MICFHRTIKNIFGVLPILELPAIKIHCSVLAEEAIHRAIDDFKSLRNND